MTSPATLRAAIYARVSTLDQEPENQLAELRRYVDARGWQATEYVDRGVSGAKDRRPPWMPCSEMPAADAATWSSADTWIGSVATCAIS